MADDLVLLAEDDIGHRYLFEHAFSKVAGERRLLVCNTGEEMMEYLNDPSNPMPRIIFLDINLPGMSGLDCLKSIRETPWLAAIPVVIHSTSNDIADERRALLYRANLFIRKTGDQDELKYILSKVLKMEWIENILRPMQ